jgi:4a-hydroxytetrahydrobiopterin dehydratase
MPDADPALSQQHCVPCEGGVPVLTPAAVEALLGQVTGWTVVEHLKIRKEVRCDDFMTAIGLMRQIAELAEADGHHPDLHLTGYRQLAIELWTHAIGGLSTNDFILAAKIDTVLAPHPQ